MFLAFTYFADVCLLNSILFFMPMILKGFGMSNLQTGFVAAIPSVAGFFAVILWGRHSDRTGERTVHVALPLAIGGAALLAAGRARRSHSTYRRIDDRLRRHASRSRRRSGPSPPRSSPGRPPREDTPRSVRSASWAASSAPSIIGYLRDLTGDFRYGLGLFGALAILVAVIFYFVGRTHETAAAASPNR